MNHNTNNQITNQVLIFLIFGFVSYAYIKHLEYLTLQEHLKNIHIKLEVLEQNQNLKYNFFEKNQKGQTQSGLLPNLDKQTIIYIGGTIVFVLCSLACWIWLMHSSTNEAINSINTNLCNTCDALVANSQELGKATENINTNIEVAVDKINMNTLEASSKLQSLRKDVSHDMYSILKEFFRRDNAYINSSFEKPYIPERHTSLDEANKINEILNRNK